ncbi:MAG: glycosyltransferase family 4 protein [Bacteroidales bacterium]|nr:glycosyltransferase family 4 protein [Bacteroidales bacterium]
MPKLIRITTVPISLKYLLKGQMHFMQKNGFEVLMISSAGKEVADVIESERCPHFVFPLTRRINPYKDLKTLFLLYRFFKKEKPQIVHTHTPKAGTTGMLAAWLARIPVRIHTVAGLPLMETTGAKRKLLFWVEKITYACATKVYPNSFGLKDYILQKKLCQPSKVKVIGNGSSNGIDLEYFSKNKVNGYTTDEIKKKYNIKKGDFVFIFIGRLVRDKGINELVSAFINLNLKYPNSKLVLVGDEEPDLSPLDINTKLLMSQHPDILLTGFISDIRPFFAISHVLVFPSYREGFPNVPLQALAMELPAIVSDIAGCNEIIINEFNGLIIPPKNTNALIDAMVRLMVDHKLYENLCLNTRPSIYSRYEQHYIWNLIKNEYEEQLRLVGIS